MSTQDEYNNGKHDVVQPIKQGEHNHQQDDDKQKIKPYPVADSRMTAKILEILQQAMHYKQLKKGLNETMKCLHKGVCEIVILAVDCEPIEIIMAMPGLCEEKNVQYCFIKGQAALGRACGIKRPVVCASIVFNEGSQLNSQILELKDQIESLFV